MIQKKSDQMSYFYSLAVAVGAMMESDLKSDKVICNRDKTVKYLQISYLVQDIYDEIKKRTSYIGKFRTDKDTKQHLLDLAAMTSDEADLFNPFFNKVSNEILRRINGWTRDIGSGAYLNQFSSGSVKYGRLYNFNLDSINKMCPKGWHLPTDVEWQTLLTFCGGDDVAGGVLKSLNFWNNPNLEASDKYGFGAVGGGFFSTEGDPVFSGIGTDGVYWSQTQAATGERKTFHCYNNSAYGVIYDSSKLETDRCSIRFIEDDSSFGGDIYDSDGNVYNEVKIGEQIWMAQNWSSKTYQDGSQIGTNFDTFGVCAYNNLEDNVYSNYIGDKIVFNVELLDWMNISMIGLIDNSFLETLVTGVMFNWFSIAFPSEAQNYLMFFNQNIDAIVPALNKTNTTYRRFNSYP